MHQADSHALLRILCVPDVAKQATGSHAVGAVVANRPSRNWKVPKRNKVATTTTTGNAATVEQMW